MASLTVAAVEILKKKGNDELEDDGCIWEMVMSTQRAETSNSDSISAATIPSALGAVAVYNALAKYFSLIRH